MRRFKYSGKTGWGMIFARLLIGHLYETWNPADVDLIIANPPSPGRNHTTLVIRHAATYDTADDWPFDDTHDPAIIKTTDTAQSAGKDLPGKEGAALGGWCFSVGSGRLVLVESHGCCSVSRGGSCRDGGSGAVSG